MDERGKSGEGRRSRAHEFRRLVLGVPTDDLGLRVEESSVGRRRDRELSGLVEDQTEMRKEGSNSRPQQQLQTSPPSRWWQPDPGSEIQEQKRPLKRLL